MAAWTGEAVIEAPVIIRPRVGGIAFVDELPTDRGLEDALLPWLLAAQSILCLVGCTIVDLGAEFAAGGVL
ncbi:hypothetical protein [Streptomyces formicae]|uniref:Uncharacterized protein n=1 Tax=Streptomyces formicae TaxID=1616117 RepID=A0ABY3WT19_9ACTN|nr:hypothetical protein [Streptomyces formicae]UNM14711.1 hypothetical protein J4032_27515 [Streptomyces formicae]